MSSICKLRGCIRPAPIGPKGFPSEYCSPGHRLDAVLSGEADDWLRIADALFKLQHKDTYRSVIHILGLPHNQAPFNDVLKQFRDQWKHTSSPPNVVHIWRIHCDRGHIKRFEQYQLAIERKSKIPGGNSKRLWHGTVRKCTVGDSDKAGFCNDASCAVCNIMHTSFRIAQAGQRHGFRRFGAGIYTTATSSKANDYVVQAGGSGFKAMFLSEVVLGPVIRMTKGDRTLTQPPAGYDSVLGEPGAELNYDEAIVYKNEAIRPLFLVIYKH